MPSIKRFSGEYEFLSNFYPVEIWYLNRFYPSVEHAFVAAKTEDDSIRQQVVLIPADEAGKAKKFGKTFELRPNWNIKRVPFMRYFVFQKFLLYSDMCKRLMATGDRELIEGNTWGDTFWGVCEGVGQNNLGKILMEARKEAFARFGKQPLLFS